jgi:hypothetical protein
MIWNNVIVRLLAYYVAVLIFFVSVMTAFPAIVEMQVAERNRMPAGLDAAVEVQEPVEQETGITEIVQLDVVVPVMLGMVGALLLALPLSWTYSWTRRPKKYRRALAQTLVALPVAVALVLFLVKGSLALAFSLAGVVAAIRWRTRLDDTMDAVFCLRRHRHRAGQRYPTPDDCLRRIRILQLLDSVDDSYAAWTSSDAVAWVDARAGGGAPDEGSRRNACRRSGPIGLVLWVLASSENARCSISAAVCPFVPFPVDTDTS